MSGRSNAAGPHGVRGSGRRFTYRALEALRPDLVFPTPSRRLLRHASVRPSYTLITCRIFRTFGSDGFLHRMKEQPMSDENPMGQVIQIDEARIRVPFGH